MQKGKAHHAEEVGDDATCRFQQFGRSFQGATGGQQIVHDQNFSAYRDIVRLNFYNRLAVLEGVGLLESLAGQLSFFANQDQRNAEAMGQRGTKNKPARLDHSNTGQALSGIQFGKRLVDVAKGFGATEDSGDVVKQDSLVGEVRNLSDCLVEKRIEVHPLSIIEVEELVMVLHTRVRGSGVPMMFLHGLFGSGDNWWGLAARMAGVRVVLPDLRGHGLSPRGEITRQWMAQDVADTLRHLGLGPCLIGGHSLGGKIALEVALQFPELVTGVASLDMGVRDYEPQYWPRLTALQGLDLTQVDSRDEARKQLNEKIDPVTLAFLLKSLVPDEDKAGGWKWLLDLEALARGYNAIWQGVTSEFAPSAVPALFVYGGASNYVRPSDELAIRERFPRATLMPVPEAGHWLHMEKPSAVLAAMNHWLVTEHLAGVPVWQ